MKKYLFLALATVCCGLLGAQSLWDSDSLFIFDKAMRDFKALKCPEVIEAEEILQDAAKGDLDLEALQGIAYADEEDIKTLNEYATALLLLERVQANDAAAYRSGLAAFRTDFPKGRCLSTLTQMDQLLTRCPKCKGQCIKRVNCNRCKNTQLCATCKGEGHVVTQGMKRTRRVPAYYRTENTSSDSPRRIRKTGSHRTSFYRKSYEEVVESNDTERKCPTCSGTGKCLTCQNKRKRSDCSTCKNTGFVPNTKTLPKVFEKVATEGIKANAGKAPEARKRWSESQAMTKAMEQLRTIYNRDEAIQTLQKMLADYPASVQHASCDQLLKFFILQKENEAKQERAAEKQTALEAQEVALVRKALNEAMQVTSLTDRLEVLRGIARRHPKAKNRTEIETAVSICTLELEQAEEELRAAINLISMEEDPKIGMRRCDELAKKIDPTSRLMESLQDTRKQFAEEDKKATRWRYGIYAVIGAIILIVIYCIISVFAPRR